jgi:hypothetical protein
MGCIIAEAVITFAGVSCGGFDTQEVIKTGIRQDISFAITGSRLCDSLN